jgi:hypothetical protein
MTTGITDGLVPAYATLAANVFALTAVFGVLSRNDAIAKLQEGLEFTGRAAGRNLTLVAQKLQEITDNAISAEQAMRTTAVGVSAGFSQAQMEGLAKVAKGAALALGRDLGDAMDRLTRGAAKLEPEILDELGIMVRLDRAVRDYAIANNKAHTELTQFERRMAFTNAIIEDGVSKFSALSESMNPSAYSQLSATFADLTKTFINGINTFFGPLLSFFAQTPIALGAVAAAFGASLTGQIMGGLKGMAEESAKASKATKNLVGESLKGVKANEKLGKAFNEVASGVNREKKDLDRMMKSLNMTINMTSKDTKKLKIAKKVRNQLTKEIQLQAIAEAKGTHGKALSIMQTHGLTAAAKVQAQAFRELGAAHTAATATTTGFATASVYARTTTAALAMSVRFLGAAFLTAMPYIAGIMFAISLLSPLYQKFMKDNTALGKALKDNEKRFDEFNETAAQYVDTIPHATEETSIWITTLRPLAGLLTESSTALDSAFSAAKVDRIKNMAAATKKLISAQEKAAKNPNPRGQFGAEIQVRSAQASLDEAGQFDAATLLRLEETAISATTGVLNSIETMRAGLTAGIEAERKRDGNSPESKKKIAEMEARIKGTKDLLDSTSAEIETAFNTYAMSAKGEEDFTALAKVIKAAANNANSATDAFMSFGETIKKAKEIVGDPKATWGVYSKEIDNVNEAIGKLNAQGENAPNDQQRQDLLAAYGIGTDSKKTIDDVRLALEDINERTKVHSADTANLKYSEALGINELANAREAERLATEKASIIAKELSDVSIKGTEKELELQNKLNEARAQEAKLIQAKYNLLADRAESSGMGATTGAALRGAALVATAEVGDKDDEIAAAKAEAAKMAMGGLVEDMRSLGPDGELMAATIEGALNMQESFSTAFQIMGDDSMSMTSKIQAGLGAAMSIVNMYAQVSKASSDAKIRQIDNEIAKEKSRDGVTAASTQKIKALEAKKEAAKKKAFEQDKKMKKAQTVIATAQAIMAAFQLGPIVGVIMGTMIAALGAKQLSIIDSMTYNGGGSGGGGGVTSMSVGQRQNTVDLAKGNNAAGEIAYARGEQGTGTGMTNYTPTPRASGGYVVGEQGPELFLPQVPGQIIPSDEINTGTTNVNFSIQAIDAQGVQDLLLEQRPNIIGMIREAANASGEFFLEDIDDGYTG